MRATFAFLLLVVLIASFALAGNNVHFCGTAIGTRCSNDFCDGCGAATTAVLSVDASLNTEEEEVVLDYIDKSEEAGSTATAEEEATGLSANVLLQPGMCRSNCAWIKYVTMSRFNAWLCHTCDNGPAPM